MQTKLSSFIEACINTAIGFVISMVLCIVVYPWFGHAFTFNENLGITLIFTVVSVIRGYVVRRWFNSRIKHLATQLGGA